MSERAKKAPKSRGAFIRAQSLHSACALVRQWEVCVFGRVCLCARQMGSRAGVSALREADVSDVRGKCQSVVLVGRQGVHHALFRR